jgi:hypothetical protein
MMTLASTQVGYSLALVATRRGDNDFALSVWPLLRLTTLAMLLWTIGLAVNLVKFEFELLRIDVLNWFSVTGRLLAIGVNSLAWGVVPYAIRNQAC